MFLGTSMAKRVVMAEREALRRHERSGLLPTPREGETLVDALAREVEAAVERAAPVGFLDDHAEAVPPSREVIMRENALVAIYRHPIFGDAEAFGCRPSTRTGSLGGRAGASVNGGALLVSCAAVRADEAALAGAWAAIDAGVGNVRANIAQVSADREAALRASADRVRAWAEGFVARVALVG